MLDPVSHRILVPDQDVAAEMVDGECLVYHPRYARAFYLNPSATLILGLCDGVRSVAEIFEMIRQAYPDASASLSDEVIATLGQLEEYGLLVRA